MFGLALPFITAVMVLRIPESPRFLVTNGRRQEALRALSWLRGPHVDVEDECHDIEESFDPSDKMTLSELFSKRELFLPLKVSVGLMIFQQFSGINVVMFYTVSIFESAGFKENATMATVFIGAVQVVVTVVACLVMDRAGRRVLLILAGTGMALSCFTLGYYYKQQAAAEANAMEITDLSWLALSSLVVYIVAFSIGLGPIPMLVMSEIFPVRARGTASGIASFICWFCGFIVTKEYATMETILGQYGAFWFFGLCCIAGVLFVWRSVPETKGKSLEDIELYFLGRGMRGI
jgi:SP family facilitated glucose transporter-like MFS transporter 8